MREYARLPASVPVSPVPPFESVKDQIETFVARRAQAEYIAKLRSAAKVERLDKK